MHYNNFNGADVYFEICIFCIIFEPASAGLARAYFGILFNYLDN